MKGKVIAIVLCVLGLVAGSVFAQSSTVFSIGASYWRAALEYDQRALAEEFGDMSIDPGNLFGPYLNIRMGKLVLGGSMFVGSFNVDYGSLLEDYGVTSDMKIKRTDLNFSVGYSLARNLTLFGAYKDMTYKTEGTFTYQDSWSGTSQTITEEDEQKGSFVGGGLSLILPFSGSPLFAYGSAAYLAANNDDWADITTVTLGLGVSLQSNLSAMVGYRVDAMGDNQKDQEKIKGVTATLAYTIR